jgi:tetratricopeptide (TPR) repeat protein
MYKVEYGGENWSGLLAALEASNMKDKDAVIDIIRNTGELATRKTKLKSLDNGEPYQQMLKEIYPKLRKVESHAFYNVKGFDVAEAKEIIKTRPQQLSLEEMFRIANSYQAGGNDFIDVFETAVRMFPDDEVANLNAAAAALSAKNLTNAEKYLKRSNVSSPEYANNIGVLYLLSGDMDKAKAQFSKAAGSGIEAARYNLKEVEKKIEYDAQIK